MEADITCHYDEEDRAYTLLCAYTPESSTVTVLAPANLAGISATVSSGELKLTYEDISLDAGSCSAAAVSPVAALPRLVAAVTAAYCRWSSPTGSFSSPPHAVSRSVSISAKSIAFRTVLPP